MFGASTRRLRLSHLEISARPAYQWLKRFLESRESTLAHHAVPSFAKYPKGTAWCCERGGTVIIGSLVDASIPLSGYGSLHTIVDSVFCQGMLILRTLLTLQSHSQVSASNTTPSSPPSPWHTHTPSHKTIQTAKLASSSYNSNQSTCPSRSSSSRSSSTDQTPRPHN